MITPEIETEAAIYAEGTRYTTADILSYYRDYLESTVADCPMDIQRYCWQILGIRDGTYQIAFVIEGTGEFDVVERFQAGDDSDANEYAEREYGDRDWYVLDSQGRNINGGTDQED